MPGRYSTRRRRSVVPRYTSIKNQVVIGAGSTGTPTTNLVAKAVNTPLSTVNSDVANGSSIQAIWVNINGCGLAASGVLNNMGIMLMKNPGANLTEPNPFNWGTSNEKKFVIRSWLFMIMRNQDGNVPFHWEGWVKVPKPYQRMGTDDTWTITFANTAAVTGHFSAEFIYKWKR